VGDKWTLLIVRDLVSGPRRFVELQRVLPGISTEQLRSRLNRMVADGMLTRRRYREVPPRVEYELTDRARELIPILGELARWGYEWAWSAPRRSEEIDLGAIFRLAPALVEGAGIDGTVEFAVTGENSHNGAAVGEAGSDDGAAETTRSYTLTIADGEVTVEERKPQRPHARVGADVAAWIKALSPAQDRAGLQIKGDRRLAERLLDGLTPTGEAEATSARAA
jgi:DNA-binding HxlR family transcriptional regulator